MSHTRHDRSTQILLLQSIRRDPEERGESITCSRKDVRIDYIKRSRKLDPTKTPEACRTVHCRPDAYATAVLPCSWSGPERKRAYQEAAYSGAFSRMAVLSETRNKSGSQAGKPEDQPWPDQRARFQCYSKGIRCGHNGRGN